MSRLSIHQIESLTRGMQATLDRDAHALRKMAPARRRHAEAKLASYRDELAAREAQACEETASQAPPRERASVQQIRTAPPADPEPPRAEPDDDLTVMVRAILTRYTLGTVSDELWRVEGLLFGTLTQPRIARPRRTA